MTIHRRMTDLCAIQGQLVDVRNVGTHKCVKLTIHVPAEYARRVIDAFGWATGVDPVSVAIARLGADTSSTTSTGGKETTSDAPPPPASTQPQAGADKRLAKEAGRLCNDPKFWAYLREKRSLTCSQAEHAVSYVYGFCGINSRREILPGTASEQRWNLLKSAYLAWDKAPSCGVET